MTHFWLVFVHGDLSFVFGVPFKLERLGIDVALSGIEHGVVDCVKIEIREDVSNFCSQIIQLN